MERLFNLDPQLIHDTILLAINVFVLFFLLSYILFKPVRKILEERKAKIKSDNEEAEMSKSEALKLKDEYEFKLKNADKQADEILAATRKKASNNEEQIIREAKTEAKKITDNARREAELEKEKVRDDVKSEIINVASTMASKVAKVNLSENDKEKLLDQTLEEIGEETWLN